MKDFPKEKEYIVLKDRSRHVSILPLVATFFIGLILFGLTAFGWVARDWYGGSPATIVPTKTVVASVAATATSVFPAIQTEIAGLRGGSETTATMTTARTAQQPAPTSTLTVDEFKLSTLPFCHELTPSRTPVECVSLKTKIANTPIPTATATPVPYCPRETMPVGWDGLGYVCILIDYRFHPPW